MKRELEDSDVDKPPPKRFESNVDPQHWGLHEVQRWANSDPRDCVLPLYTDETSLLCDGGMLHFVHTEGESALAEVTTNPCHAAFILSQVKHLFEPKQHRVQMTSAQILEKVAEIVATKRAEAVSQVVGAFRQNGIVTVDMIMRLSTNRSWFQSPLGIDPLLGHFVVRQLLAAIPPPTTPQILTTAATQASIPTAVTTPTITAATPTLLGTPTSLSPFTSRLMYTPHHPPKTPSTVPPPPPLLIRSIMVMQAAPLVYAIDDEQKDLRPVAALDLKDEERIVWSLKCQTRSPIRLTFKHATVAEFDHASDYSILHLSGHGIIRPNQPPALLFESATGKAKLVTGAMLRQLLMPGTPAVSSVSSNITTTAPPRSNIKCVFLSTCSSLCFADVFLEGGIPCVIATTKEVQDTYAKMFAESFYSYIFRFAHRTDLRPTELLREAFDRAFARVSTEHPEEAQKFEFRASQSATPTTQPLQIMPAMRLEPQLASPIQGPFPTVAVSTQEVLHSPMFAATQQEPSFEEDSDTVPHTTKLKANVDHFVGRELDMHKILDVLDRSEPRLVHVKGPVGIGKTALARGFALYMDQRKYWRAKFRDGIYFVELECVSTAEAVCEAIFAAMKAQKQQEPSWLTSDMQFAGETAFLEKLRGCYCLFVLDGCDQAIEEMGSVLTKFMDLCHHIKFVCTSRRVLPVIEAHAPHPYDLPDLAIDDCKQLFAKLCARSIDRHELDGTENQLLVWMSQHPASIVIAASFVRRRSIADVAERLAFLRDRPGKDPQLQKLDFTLDSVFRDLTPAAQRLYSFLALVPAGASEVLLNTVFASRDNWYESMECLENHSLVAGVTPSVVVAGGTKSDALDEPHIRYRLAFYFVVSHAQKKFNEIATEDYRCLEWHATICKFYADRCERICVMWLGPQNQSAVEWVQSHEGNIWECLSHAQAQALHALDNSPSKRQFQALSEAHAYPTTVGTIAANISHVFRWKERRRDSAKAITIALDVCTKHCNLLGAAKCHFANSKMLTEARDVQGSREQLVRAMALFSYVSDQQGYLEALELLTTLQLRFGPKFSRAMLLGTLDYLFEHEHQHPCSHAIFGATSKAREHMDLPTDELIDKTIALAKEANNPVFEAHMLLAKGKYVLQFRNDAKEARRLYHKALQRYKVAQNVFSEAETEQRLGLLEHKHGDKSAALKHYERAQQRYQQCGMTVSKLNVQTTIAEIHFELAKEDVAQNNIGAARSRARCAKDLLVDACKQFNKFGRQYGEGAALRVLGTLLYWHSKFPDNNGFRLQAIKFLNQAKDLIARTESNGLTIQGARLQFRACQCLVEIYTDSDTVQPPREERYLQALKNREEAKKLAQFLCENDTNVQRAVEEICMLCERLTTPTATTHAPDSTFVNMDHVA